MMTRIILILLASVTAAFAVVEGSEKKVKVVVRDSASEKVSPACTLHYKIPERFRLDTVLTEQQKTIFTLIEKGKTVQNGILLLGEFTQHCDSVKTFEEYNRREMQFLRGYGIIPLITALPIPAGAESSYECRYEKWTAVPYLFKKVIRYRLPDGYYCISINGGSEAQLEDPSFYELLESASFTCPK